jgi:hypothetical protein
MLTVKTLANLEVPAFYLITEHDTHLFQGPRTASALFDFVARLLGVGLETADSSWALAGDDRVLQILSHGTPSPAFSEAFAAFKNQGIRFGIANRESGFAGENGAIWLCRGGNQMLYEGEQSASSLQEAITAFFRLSDTL